MRQIIILIGLMVIGLAAAGLIANRLIRRARRDIQALKEWKKSEKLKDKTRYHPRP